MRHDRRRIGVIGNPRSHAYRGGLQGAGAPDPRLLFAEPPDKAGLLDALLHFADSGVDLLVVQGGDGTLRDVLSLLPKAYPDREPELAISASGNTNLAARVFGRVGPGPRGLARLVRAADRGRLRRSVCRTLQVGWPDQADRAPLRGLFLGAAGYADGKRIADQEVHRRGLHSGPAVGLAVAATLLSALFGRDGTLRRGTPMRIAPQGSAVSDGPCLLFLATTLDRLMGGIWPFWGREPGGIHWLDIEAPRRGLGRTMLAILSRRFASSRNAPGHRSGRADRIALRFPGAFVLDGEFFDTGPGGVLLGLGAPVTIVRP